MSHLPTLIQDLALILAIASVTTLLFKKLKQPVVLGYILAGILVGPNFSLLPSISDLEGVKVWADIGVIFLLFSLGLEFSFKKLVNIGGTAGVTGIFEVVCMVGLGYVTGKLMGWPFMDCIFLGGIIAISSTTIIIRSFDELGVKTRKFASVVMGVLVVEDLVAVLLMVLLSTLAVSREFAGMEMLYSVLKLAFFLFLWFLSGIFLIPGFLKWGRKIMNEETMLVISLGLCLLMVVAATYAGFSAPLGAFIMGSILAETPQAEKIEHLVQPVKNLFGAVFFVSVGLLIEPDMLMKYIGPVFILSFVVILGKTVNITFGALLSGQPLKQSLQAGMSMAQIGEFSFIIATLGLSLQVTSDYLYPIAVGVSVITTFTTPYMIRLADPLFTWLAPRLPIRWRMAINQYSTGAQTIQAESEWRIVLRSYLLLMATNSVIVIALVFLSGTYLLPFVKGSVHGEILASILTFVITLVATAPFLWALSIRKMHSLSYRNLWLDKKYNHGPLVMLEVVRNLLMVVMVGFMVDLLFGTIIAFVAILPVIVVVLLVFSRRLNSFYARIEKRFLTNLNQREQMQSSASGDLTPWDAHMAYFTMPPESTVVGKTLVELAWREQYGINIAYIERGSFTITAPARTDVLYPFDKIAVIGTDVQLEQFRSILESAILPAKNVEEEITLNKIIVDEHIAVRGKTLRASGIREATNGLVVGIERNGERILNPDSTTVFEWDDIVWIVGERKKIEELKVSGIQKMGNGQ
ncbi:MULTISPECIES: cation:proton antiporter domain-containing protein [Niastella]|uniref:Cation:proton antiporter n=1 Tax=Niastella soli TaxID=2821487 RepID=A0ABS3Z0D2_9BACT|nr:cation:proton antiporter [Niastella soli]MBO9203624.1 cation:proton antiporter [Niastella soli]